ncbi:MAG: hypothetical protein WBG50_13395 [Desulfomonilaceae bacterium]
MINADKIDKAESFEIVTVLVRKADYLELNKSGVPRPEQIALALWHYLRLIDETKLIPPTNGPEIFNGGLTTFRCALPRELCDRIRALAGRFDRHIMEAVRLWLL